MDYSFCDELMTSLYALLQFAGVFCTEIAVEKHFVPPKCDFWRGLGGLKKFSRFAIARHI